jgi:hypothetical protein
MPQAGTVAVIAIGEVSGRGYPGAGGASAWAAAGGVIVLALLTSWMWIAWRRRERARQVTRYEFTERGHIRPVPPASVREKTHQR